MGAFGCWSLASTEPQLFAAIAPICGGFTEQLPRVTTLQQLLRKGTERHQCRARQRALKKFKGIVPVWLFHGMKDKIVPPQVSQDIYDALGGIAKRKTFLRITMYANLAHACWRKAYSTRELYAWLLMHSRLAAQAAGGSQPRRPRLADQAAEGSQPSVCVNRA